MITLTMQLRCINWPLAGVDAIAPDSASQALIDNNMLTAGIWLVGFEGITTHEACGSDRN